MRRVQNSAVAYIVASLVALAGVLGSSPTSAGATPGKIPDGPVNFHILGGNLSFGGQVTGTLVINQNLPHPDVPPECSDGVDNEVGTFHAWYTNTPVTGTPLTPVAATDGRIDFGTATGQENSNLPVFSNTAPSGTYVSTPANTGCENATDNLEMFDRQYITPDPLDPKKVAKSQFVGCVDKQLFGQPVTPNVEAAPGCGPNNGIGDSCDNTTTANTGCTRAWASNVFGNGTTGQGQEKSRSEANGGTVSGTSVSVPQAGVKFARGYQAQGTCQTTLGITACVDLYVEFAIQPASAITGTTNPDGSGTVVANFNLVIKLGMTYDSNDPFGGVPNRAICPSLSPISMSLTTESSGSLSGTRYDDFSQNFKVVEDPFTVSAFATTQGQYGGTLANLCSELNKQMFGADSPTAQATNGKATLIISTQDTSNTPTSSAAGTGMPWSVTTPTAISGPNWNPVAAIRSNVASAGFTPPVTTNSTVSVNEGDLVQLDSSVSYDPAMRPFTTNTFSRTGGTAPVPPASTGTPNSTYNFVAQDAPSGGNNHIFTKSVQTDLGPFDQTQSDTRDLTVQVDNVAPTANAGPNRTVSGGSTVALNGTSTDPGDLDLAGQRGYCWTQTGGTPVGLPACAGSPSNNRPSDGTTGRFLPLNFTPANTDDYKIFDLVVCDKDGGCSSTSSTDVNVRAQAAGSISGIISDGGAPLDAATVTLYNSGGFVASTSSNPSGAYSFSGLAPGSTYYVSASKATYDTVFFSGTQAAATARRLSVSGAVGRSDIDIELVSLSLVGGISGNLQDSTPTNISGMGVRLYDEYGFVASSSSDGSGNYSFTNLTPKSSYKLRFNCTSGCGPSLPFVDTWHANAMSGNMATLVTAPIASTNNIGTDTIYRTSGPDQRHTISGTVTGGGPLQGVQVRVYDFTTGAWVANAVTDSSGNYSMTVLPGSYKVWFWTKNIALVPPPPAGTQARTSQWYDGPGTFIDGQQIQGSG